jgi:hypothetical protein
MWLQKQQVEVRAHVSSEQILLSLSRQASPLPYKPHETGNRDVSKGSLLAGHFQEGQFCLLPENIHQIAWLGLVWIGSVWLGVSQG